MPRELKKRSDEKLLPNDGRHWNLDGVKGVDVFCEARGAGRKKKKQQQSQKKRRKTELRRREKPKEFILHGGQDG